MRINKRKVTSARLEALRAQVEPQFAVVTESFRQWSEGLLTYPEVTIRMALHQNLLDAIDAEYNFLQSDHPTAKAERFIITKRK